MILNFLNKNKNYIPEQLQMLLLEHFPGAMNIEWLQAGDLLEAVFYVDSSEHIAKFDLSGHLKNYKVNLLKEAVPDLIKSAAISYGEIMSVIGIVTDREHTFEVIMRRADQSRQILLFDVHGNIIEVKKV